MAHQELPPSSYEEFSNPPLANTEECDIAAKRTRISNFLIKLINYLFLIPLKKFTQESISCRIEVVCVKTLQAGKSSFGPLPRNRPNWHADMPGPEHRQFFLPPPRVAP